ncbi:uncharacterized protein LOC143611588 [Bidens hawaiensis]|uniref:uncharacterized protein LOC143577157 n=1 Tax=Bidens hawaiensis TaxID=980011 RepID=UPI00404AD167
MANFVPREENAEADALANLASSLRIPDGVMIPITHILTPMIEEVQINEVSDTEDMEIQDPEDTKESWTIRIIKYTQDGKISKDENPRSFRTKVTPYIILNNLLYRRSLAGPYLRCLEKPEALEVLKDIHEGDCGNHTGAEHCFPRP